MLWVQVLPCSVGGARVRARDGGGSADGDAGTGTAGRGAAGACGAARGTGSAAWGCAEVRQLFVFTAAAGRGCGDCFAFAAEPGDRMPRARGAPVVFGFGGATGGGAGGGFAGVGGDLPALPGVGGG